MISRRLIGRKISSTEISSANIELSEAVEKWRMRDLSSECVKYMFIDGVNFHMRIAQDIETVPILAAIGVTKAGHRLVLGLQPNDKESASIQAGEINQFTLNQGNQHHPRSKFLST